MKRLLISLCLGLSVLLTGCTRQIRIFNGQNLSGWKPYLGEQSVSPERIWSVHSGIIRCEGKPNGYIRTTRTYSNYKLHLEWRWPEAPTNSGVLLNITGADQVWPNCIEAQLRSGDAGDLILIGEDVTLAVNGNPLQPKDSRYLRIPRINPSSSEKKAGQWNTYDILNKNGTIEVRINGVLQNKGTNCSLASGYIGLQSEGSPIEFRNIFIEPLM